MASDPVRLPARGSCRSTGNYSRPTEEQQPQYQHIDIVAPVLADKIAHDPPLPLIRPGRQLTRARTARIPELPQIAVLLIEDRPAELAAKDADLVLKIDRLKVIIRNRPTTSLVIRSRWLCVAVSAWRHFSPSSLISFRYIRPECRIPDQLMDDPNRAVNSSIS